MSKPSVVEIREEVQRISQSSYLRQAGVLQKFLHFVVDSTLEGRSDEIKEYTVGVEVLNRPNGYNPQQDASVRIHAVRLRKMLNAWYENEGKDSPVKVWLEKGSYQPTFSYQAISRANTEDGNNKTLPGQNLPKDSICILPFECYAGPNQDPGVIQDGFCAELSEALSLFQDVEVISWYGTSKFLANGGSVENIGEAFNASYLVSGRIQVSETDITATVYLTEPIDPMPIWSQIFIQPVEGQSLMAIIKEISEKIISMLVDYNGFIHIHRYGARGFSTLPSNKTSLSIFWLYHFVTRNTEEIYLEALHTLEQAVKEDPDSPLAWAILGQMQFNGVIYGYKNGAEQLELSKKSFEKAILLDPESQHGSMGLFLSKLIEGKPEEAKGHLQKCIKINPNSGYFQATASLGYCFLGEYQKAIELVKKAYSSNTVPIWWLCIPEYLAALVNGNYSTALQLAPRYHPAAGILQNIFEIIALYHLGEEDSFRDLARAYNERKPGGLQHAAFFLNTLFVDKKASALFKEALDDAAQYLTLPQKSF